MATILLLQAGSGIAAFIPIIAFFLIMYFLIILPQRREQKRHRAMLEALKVGDEVVTAGGLIGDVIKMNGDQIVLKTGDARVLVARGRIARLVAEPAERS